MKQILFYIAFIFALSSCELVTSIAPDLIGHEGEPIPVDSIPQDTIPQDTVPLPAIIDTCTGLINYTSPQFIRGAILLKPPPTNPVWRIGYDWNNISGSDPCALLAAYYPGLPCELYYNGGTAWTIIITGTSDYAEMNKSYRSLWARNADGTKVSSTWSKQRLNQWGSVSASQFIDLIDQYKSVTYVGFAYTSYTCEEYTAIIQHLLDLCIDGTGRTFDAKAIPCSIDPAYYEALQNNNWTVLL